MAKKNKTCYLHTIESQDCPDCRKKGRSAYRTRKDDYGSDIYEYCLRCNGSGIQITEKMEHLSTRQVAAINKLLKGKK